MRFSAKGCRGLFLLLILGLLLGALKLVSCARTWIGGSMCDGLARVGRDRAPGLRTNQVGYDLDLAKHALLVNVARGQRNLEARLIETATGRVRLEVQPGKAILDEVSGDVIQLIDFTKLYTPGEYYLEYDNMRSHPFRIGKNVFHSAMVTLLRSYYLQRCGVAIDDPITGIAHKACHTRDAEIAHDDDFHHSGDYVPTSGGWHDAGDYGKYVSTTAVTVGRLLFLYEQLPDRFVDGQLALPESGNGIADLLDEMKVGLLWLNTMQRPDGAVYRKLSGRKWPGIESPQRDRQRRLIYGISTQETAKLAAVDAMAARIYEEVDPEFAHQCLEAATKAWAYLAQTPQVRVDRRDGDDSGSGGYLPEGSGNETDPFADRGDRFWAAAELYLTTKDTRYEEVLGAQLPNKTYTPFGWEDPSAQGLLDLYLEPDVPPSWKFQIHGKLLARAAWILRQVKENGYGIATPNFVWGSNRLTAEDGLTLFFAYRLTGLRDYLDAALGQVDYLLGVNHFDTCFVSGIGANPVRNVAHMFARAAEIEIPGLLVGGPNEKAEDGVAPEGLGPLSWIDDARSYATNENAIDYNAPLIALMGFLMTEP